MKLNEQMRYPHPVLSEYSSDYVSGEFRCGFEQNITTGGELRLASHLQLNCPTLTDLVSTQQAAVGYFVVCRRTYFNMLQEVPLGDSEKFFDVRKLFGTVVIRPVVWTLAQLDNFSSPLIDHEFGSPVSIAKGAVMALGPEFRFSIDQKKYKPFDSIFELALSPDLTPGTVAVDPEQDRITILAESETHKSIAAMRGLTQSRSILLNAVYLPVVMEVVCRLQTQNSGLERRKWYRVFKAKCDDIGIDPRTSKQSPLEIAQKLLREPLKKTIAVMENSR